MKMASETQKQQQQLSYVCSFCGLIKVEKCENEKKNAKKSASRLMV